MKVDGSCHCGEIKFEAEISPERVAVCHCSDCQTMSGSAFRVVVQVPSDQFTFLTGSTKVYVKTAENGNLREQHFCGTCGTHIYATSPDDGLKPLGIRISTLAQRAELTPSVQVWCRSAQSWVNDLGSFKALETGPSPRL